MALTDESVGNAVWATSNSTEMTPWVEKVFYGGFRIWQVLFLAGGVLLAIVIMLCCCLRIRIPRTKQEIEADFRRKQLAKRFRQELKRIRNSELDVMDLKRALDRVRADFVSDSESFCGNQSELLSSIIQGVSPGDRSPVDTSDNTAWLEMQMSKFRSAGPPKTHTVRV